MVVHKNIIKLFLITVLILFLVGLLIAVFMGGLGGGKSSGSKIAVIEVKGEITGGESGNTQRGQQVAGAETLLRQVRMAENDPSIKAVLLRIDSPGGSAPASEEVYMELKRLKERTGKPIVAVMEDMAASGGYFIAVAADTIFANPASMTGSIGVIMRFNNYHGLYTKYGIKVEVIKSGKYKDIGSSSREMTADERQLLQKMVNQIYGRFVAAVETGRDLPHERVLELAQGQLYTGMEAKRLKLVDRLGNFYDAVEYTAALVGLRSEPALEYYRTKPSFLEQLLSGFSGSNYSFFGKLNNNQPFATDILLLEESLNSPGLRNIKLEY